MTTKLSIETYPNKVAADYIRGKAVADPKNFGNLPSQLKQRAFAVAGIEELDAVRKIRDAVATLPEGANWDVVKKEIAKKISPFVGDGGMDEAARDKAANARAEFLLRTHGFQAYSVARHQQQMATVGSHPYWMYETVGDNRVRAGHAALDGKVLRADDPWWKTHYPPWDWGCRCIVIALDEEDAQEYGITPSGQMPNPERSSSYSFNASDAGISLDQITERHDDDYCRDLFDSARKVTVQRDDGKKETMWDYMLDRHMKAKAKLLAAATWREGKEHALVLDFETGKQIGDVIVGDKKSVKIPIPTGKTVCTLHTHPNGDNTPSARDLLTGHNFKNNVDYIGAGRMLRRWKWLKKPTFEYETILESYAVDNDANKLDFDAYEAFLDRLIKEGFIKMEELA